MLKEWYYRDIDGKEIDLLKVEGDDVYQIEIKKSKNPSNPDKNLLVLSKLKINMKPVLIICMADELLPLNRDVWFCPVSVL